MVLIRNLHHIFLKSLYTSCKV